MKINTIKEFTNSVNCSTEYIVIIYFDSILCHSCIPKFQIINNIKKSNNNIIIKIVDIDNSNKLVSHLDITSVPLVNIYKNKIKIHEIYGNDINHEYLKKIINKLL